MKKKFVLMIAILVVAIAAGAGTYAYFNARVKSTGNSFTTATVKLNGGTDIDVGKLFDNEVDWKPGASKNNTLTISNDGSIDVDLKGRIKMTLTGEHSPDPSKLIVTIDDIKYTPKGGTASSVESMFGLTKGKEYNYGTNKSDLDGTNYILKSPENEPFKSGDKVEIEYTVKLDGTADNDWQNAIVAGGFEVLARQADLSGDTGWPESAL